MEIRCGKKKIRNGWIIGREEKGMEVKGEQKEQNTYKWLV